MPLAQATVRRSRIASKTASPVTSVTQKPARHAPNTDMWWSEAPIIKQVKVQDRGRRLDAVSETTKRVEEVVALEQTAMLGRHEVGARGGTGRTFDWSIAAEVAGLLTSQPPLGRPNLVSAGRE